MNQSKPNKAGLIPYILTKDGPKFLFMVSSDPRYGGEFPMISKGFIEPGETHIGAAIREAKEELGLIEGNVCGEFYHLGTFTNNGADIVVALVKVTDPMNFNLPHYETAYTVWLTLSQFENYGRKNQVKIIQLAYDSIMK